MSDTTNQAKTTGSGDDRPKQTVLKVLREAPEFYTLLSLCTKAPYVLCDPETFDDEIMIYFDPEAAKKAAESLLNAKIPINIVKVEEKQKLLFLTGLFPLGVNALLVHGAEGSVRVQLNELVKRENPGKQPDGSIWIENPELHLTMLYYAQEARKPAQGENRDDSGLKGMQDEIMADFRKGTFILAAPKDENGIPLVKLEDGKMYQPLFTDVIEFRRFNREDSFRPLMAEADKIPQILPEGVEGVILNPLGVKLPLTVQRQGKKQGETPDTAAVEQEAAKE